MDCGLAIDIVTLLVAIAALCVTIWIGVTAHNFAVSRAAREDKDNKELNENIKAIKEEVKGQNEEKTKNVLDVTKEKIEKKFDNDLEPIITNVEELKKEMNNLHSKIEELKNLTIKLE